MKKIIAAAAGLFMANSIAASVSAADIFFDGDARARFNYHSNYQDAASLKPQDSEESFWTSRVRLQFKINTKGGAYAVGRFCLADGTWDGADGSTNGTLSYGQKSNFDVDIGYVGVPMGPIALEAGMGYNTMSKFIRGDNVYDFIRAVYTTDRTTLVAFMEKLSEYEWNLTTDPLTGNKVPMLDKDGNPVIDNGFTTDHDINQYGVNLIQKLAGDWQMNAVLLYRDDQQANSNGIAADFLFTGKAGDINLAAEAAYKNAAYQGTDKAGFGGYVSATMPLGIASLAMTAGVTNNGFTASGDFGGDGQKYAQFVMLSKASGDVVGMLATGVLIGSSTGDAYFFNVVSSVKVSDKLTLTAASTYMNADYGNANLNIVEVGGIASYQVTSGAAITALLGYLNIEGADKKPLGFGLALDLTF